MNIGNAIKTIRKEQGITQLELSDKTGISQTSLSQIESGLKRPSDKNLKKICEVLEIPQSIVYILGMEDTDVPASKKNIYKLLFPSIKNLALDIARQDSSD
jgi:transcriptional regulator with XRE-family HTH domain